MEKDFSKEELKHLHNTIRACKVLEEKYNMNRTDEVKNMDKQLTSKLKKKIMGGI